MNDITCWDGMAWRVPSGYEHDRTTTVLDIYKHESEELGNDMPVYGDALDLYGHLPARKAVWVCANKTDVKRYGSKAERWYLQGVVVCDDDQGGYLVIQTNQGA